MGKIGILRKWKTVFCVVLIWIFSQQISQEYNCKVEGHHRVILQISEKAIYNQLHKDLKSMWCANFGHTPFSLWSIFLNTVFANSEELFNKTIKGTNESIFKSQFLAYVTMAAHCASQTKNLANLVDFPVLKLLKLLSKNNF